MKYLLGMAALLLSFNVYSQEIVVVEKQGKTYALVTSCTTTSRPTAVSSTGKARERFYRELKTRKKTHKS